MEKELKPCPFCNSVNVAQGASSGSISVWCLCGARGPDVDFPEDCIDPAKPISKCHELWNRRSYISALAPAEAGELMDTLRSMSHDDNTRACVSVNATVSNELAKKLFDVLHAAPKAADAIEAMSAALASERAAHAETKRERDELKADIDSYAEASSNLATELYKTEARLAEALKALEWYGEQARLARLIHSEGDKGRHALAADGGKLARRVREGGKVDG